MSIENIGEALTALQAILAAGGDEAMNERMNAAAANISPRDRIVDSIEAAYSSHELLSAEQKATLAETAIFSAEMGWHKDGRGEAIAAFLRDDSNPAPDSLHDEDEEAPPE